jgi:hypothetical protein
VNPTNAANARRPELIYHAERLTRGICPEDEPDPGLEPIGWKEAKDTDG